MSKDEVIEKLAAIEHERWSEWQTYLHSKCATSRPVGSARQSLGAGSLIIPGDYVVSLERQIATSYGELSDREKESDREQVARYWPLVVQFVAEWMESQGDEYGLGILPVEASCLAAKWREEMA